jgi:hypothetical protein
MRIVWGLVSCLACGLGTHPRALAEPPAGPAPADPDEVDDDTPESVSARVPGAIARGVEWLRARSSAQGWWGETYERDATSYAGGKDGYPGPYGPTALALYTLLKCGVPPSDPTVRRGFAWLAKKEANGGSAYEVSMKLLAVTATADPFKRTKNAVAAGERVRLVGRERKWAQQLVTALLAMRAPSGWRYWGPADRTPGGKQDLSSTQLATLALFSADRCGLKVEADVWRGVIAFTIEQQERDGPKRPRAVKAPVAGSGARSDAADGAVPKDRARGFAYVRDKAQDPEDRAASGGMTACGIANLMMARFALQKRYPLSWAREDAEALQQSIYDGLAWLDANWSPFQNPAVERTANDLYYVYCVERAMDLVGASRLGRHFWYAEMAEQVLARQHESGCWSRREDPAHPTTVLDTCFALLFLHRATRGGIPFPVVTGGDDVPPTDAR